MKFGRERAYHGANEQITGIRERRLAFFKHAE
jgi:hypothetical protein